MGKTYTLDEIKRALVRAIYKRQDNSDYDLEDNFNLDEGYIGWQEAIFFIADKLGIEFTEDEILLIAGEIDDLEC